MLRVVALLLSLAVAAIAGEAGAQVCPGGQTATADGYCLTAGQKYCGGGMACANGMFCAQGGRCAAPGCRAGQVAVDGGRFCIPADATYCGQGTACPAGTTCSGRGSCTGGGSPQGPVCASGVQCQAGYQCSPKGNCYNPTTQKVCGAAVCAINEECGPAPTECLSPHRQVALQRAGAAPGEIDINTEACRHYGVSIARAAEARKTLDRNSSIGAHEVRLQMCDVVDNTLDELIQVSGAHCPQRQPELRALIDHFRSSACSENKKSYHRGCRGNGTKFFFRDDDGRMKVGLCSAGGGGVRG